MDPELAAIAAELDWVLDAHLRCLAGLTPEWLAWSPTIEGANSPSAILGHTLGVTAAFVLGVAGGEPWTRDRAAEFETTFAARTDLDLGDVILPDEAAWGSPPEGPLPRRRVLLEALRHASIHLGEMRFTRSLIDEGRQV
jgi:hypothetical protein